MRCWRATWRRRALEFNRALELVMQWSGGPAADPRLRAHFDRLVERVSAVEILALAEGDGFAEQRSEPAAIDALLDTPEPPSRPPKPPAGPKATSSPPNTTSPSRSTTGCCRTWSCSAAV